jgi:hypothetical protein
MTLGRIMVPVSWEAGVAGCLVMDAWRPSSLDGPCACVSVLPSHQGPPIGPSLSICGLSTKIEIGVGMKYIRMHWNRTNNLYWIDCRLAGRSVVRGVRPWPHHHHSKTQNSRLKTQNAKLDCFPLPQGGTRLWGPRPCPSDFPGKMFSSKPGTIHRSSYCPLCAGCPPSKDGLLSGPLATWLSPPQESTLQKLLC